MSKRLFGIVGMVFCAAAGACRDASLMPQPAAPSTDTAPATAAASQTAGTQAATTAATEAASQPATTPATAP